MGKGLPNAEIFLKDEKDEVLLKKFCDMPCEKNTVVFSFALLAMVHVFLQKKNSQ
jgi:hypothetical protein